MTHKQRQAIECARLFVKHRDAAKIAQSMNVTERTVYRIISLNAFHAELDALGYEGERNFRKTQRGKSQKHDKARKLWERLQTSDTPKHKHGRIIAEQTHTHIQTVRAWIRDWRKAE